jgi:hypothetical protein
MDTNTTFRQVVARVTRRVVGVGLLLYLVDLNSTQVHDFVRALVTSWRDSETRHEMSAIGSALDAEHISMKHYPAPDELADFIRRWLPATKGRDPAFDQWGEAFQIEVLRNGYLLRSCGPDAICATEDDIVRRSSDALD